MAGYVARLARVVFRAARVVFRAAVLQLTRIVFRAAVLLLFILIAISPSYVLGGLHISGDIFVMISIFFGIFGFLMGYLVTWLAEGDFSVLNEWITWSQNGLVSIIAALYMGSSYMIVHGSIFPGYVVAFLLTAIVSHVMLYGDQEVVNILLRKLALKQCNTSLVFRSLREGNYSPLRVPLGMTFICLTVQCLRGSRLVMQVEDDCTRAALVISPALDSTSSASPRLGGLARVLFSLLFRGVVLLLFISFAISPTYLLGGLYFFGYISISLSIVIFGLLTGYLLAWIAEGDFVVLNQWIAWCQHGQVSYIITGLSMGASHLVVSQSTYIYTGYLVAVLIVAIVLYVILYGDREVVYDVTTKLTWQNVQSALGSFFDGHGDALLISSALALLCWGVKLDVSRASASHSTSSASPDSSRTLGPLVSSNTRQARHGRRRGKKR